jgi:ATP-dependent exoDNAse (exonuclease V) alpha subunit
MNQITIADGKVITLNEQQREALELLAEWSRCKSLFFMLAGYAGTGKTTLVREHIRKEFNWYQERNKGLFSGEDDKGFQVAVSAPTHKAKKEIVKATGLEGKTIQAMLGLGLDVDMKDFDPEDKKFKITRTPILREFHLVVIDECGMLNTEAVTFILELAAKYGTRIIFMGDPAQLPPIGEWESICFTTDKIKYKYQLTKVERQASDNPIMSLYDKLRDNLNSKRTPYNRVTNFDKATGSGIKFVNKGEFAKEVLDDFTAEHFNPLEAKILAWTNDEANMWNGAIRKRIIMKTYPELKEPSFIEPGDLLIALANRGTINNADEFIVKSITPAVVDFMDVNQEIESLECLQIHAYSDTLGYDTYFNVLDHTDRRATAKWLLQYNAFIRQAVKDKRKWRDFFGFRDVFLTMADIDNGSNSKKPIARDLDYGYALTVHRSQGSTYNNVYVVEKDIDMNRNVRERNQLKYVALSRPRKKAVLLSF